MESWITSIAGGGVVVADLNGPPGGGDEDAWEGGAPNPYVPHKILIEVTPVQSAAVVPGVYTDRVRATDPSGFVSTQAVGTIEVRP